MVLVRKCHPTLYKIKLLELFIYSYNFILKYVLSQIALVLRLRQTIILFQ